MLCFILLCFLSLSLYRHIFLCVFCFCLLSICCSVLQIRVSSVHFSDVQFHTRTNGEKIATTATTTTIIIMVILGRERKRVVSAKLSHRLLLNERKTHAATDLVETERKNLRQNYSNLWLIITYYLPYNNNIAYSEVYR